MYAYTHTRTRPAPCRTRWRRTHSEGYHILTYTTNNQETHKP